MSRDTPTQSERISRGVQAEREIGLFDGAAKKVRAKLLDMIAASGPDDSAGREKLYLQVTLLPALRTMLEQAIGDGNLAQSEVAMAKINDAAAEGRPRN